MKKSALLLAGLVTLAACETTPATPPVSEATVQAHVDTATRLAGADLQPLLSLCKPAPAVRPKVDEHDLMALITKPSPPPAKAFDNLYFLGDSWVSAWALNTSDGIILFDTLNTDKEAATLIEGGLRKVGLNPARIKYIIVTHGHGDHSGGVNYLVRRYHPRVAMGDADWTMLETKPDFPTPMWEPAPKRDISVKDGDTITLGDTTVTMYITPGHTLGTISPVFDVKSGGEKHRVIEWGGTGFNFGKDFVRLDGFIASTKRMRAIVAEQKIDVMISNHGGYDEAPAKLAKRRQDPRGPNPFVLGTATVERSLDVMGECGVAQHDRFTMMK
jgi:metallo-beta-lactamase class B